VVAALMIRRRSVESRKQRERGDGIKYPPSSLSPLERRSEGLWAVNPKPAWWYRDTDTGEKPIARLTGGLRNTREKSDSVSPPDPVTSLRVGSAAQRKAFIDFNSRERTPAIMVSGHMVQLSKIYTDARNG